MPVAESDLWLELAARFSIVASVLVVVYFFVFTAWRITRFPNNSLWPWGNVTVNRTEIHQTPTQMPFTFSLNVQSINVMDQLIFRLECLEKPGTIRLLWGVDANYLFKVIHTPSWESIKELENTLDGSELTNDPNRPYLFVDSLHLGLDDTENFNYNLTVVTPRSLKWEELNNQYKYPLVIFILKSESVLDPMTSIVGLCAVLHVKNSTIPRPSSILAQYIKLKNGQAHLLQPLFVMDGGGSVDDSDSTAQTTNSDNLQDTDSENQPFRDVLCSVCQMLPVSRAIIPCRHVCLCAQCFSKVNSCPFCRGPISCFFKTRTESYMENIVETNEIQNIANERRPWGDILNSLNDNLNAVGFGLEQE